MSQAVSQIPPNRTLARQVALVTCSSGRISQTTVRPDILVNHLGIGSNGTLVGKVSG